MALLKYDEFNAANRPNGRVDDNILKRELSQSKFPYDWKCEKTNAVEPSGMSLKRIKDIASDIFGARYGNVEEGAEWPVYNMFNASHVRLMCDVRITDELEESGIVQFVKGYTEDTSLGPQLIYFLTDAGENVLRDILYR